MADLLAPLNPQVKCTILAGAPLLLVHRGFPGFLSDTGNIEPPAPLQNQLDRESPHPLHNLLLEQRRDPDCCRSGTLESCLAR